MPTLLDKVDIEADMSSSSLPSWTWKWIILWNRYCNLTILINKSVPGKFYFARHYGVLSKWNTKSKKIIPKPQPIIWLSMAFQHTLVDTFFTPSFIVVPSSAAYGLKGTENKVYFWTIYIATFLTKKRWIMHKRDIHDNAKCVSTLHTLVAVGLITDSLTVEPSLTAYNWIKLLLN